MCNKETWKKEEEEEDEDEEGEEEEEEGEAEDGVLEEKLKKRGEIRGMAFLTMSVTAVMCENGNVPHLLLVCQKWCL